MPAVGSPTLDQLRVFIVAAETGSFAAAGRQIGRATSAISYTIANLEQQLGVELFERDATRRPNLTEAGRAVLAKARAVTHNVEELRASVKGLMEGLEAEVSLVVDVMLPTPRLVDAIGAFETTFPTVKLRLQMETLSAVAQMVHAGVATIGVGGGAHTTEPGLELIDVGAVEMIPVAAPGHPLTGPEGEVPGAIRRHRQLVLTVRSSFREGRDIGVFAAEQWKLADLGAKHALLVAGVGWGAMPEPLVRDDLASGRLQRLRVPEARSGRYDLQAMYRTDAPPGPAAAWLVQRFADQPNAGR